MPFFERKAEAQIISLVEEQFQFQYNHTRVRVMSVHVCKMSWVSSNFYQFEVGLMSAQCSFLKIYKFYSDKPIHHYIEHFRQKNFSDSYQLLSVHSVHCVMGSICIIIAVLIGIINKAPFYNCCWWQFRILYNKFCIITTLEKQKQIFLEQLEHFTNKFRTIYFKQLELN